MPPKLLRYHWHNNTGVLLFRPVKTLTLREARKLRGWTQEQLETESGVAQAVISNLERGLVTDPASSTVFKLAKALKRDPREINFGQEAKAS